ncbi:MAG: hypothetical protein HKO59_02180 [Phycisphaerales bacterium]|nr:hypothetical protein [Phycisphaerae bacterium]NNF42204.1 hypothetical protein [Phycisphaerales bacterium]NNM24790.1 hypothetical protein [Phycisphaerales bacterium]
MTRPRFDSGMVARSEAVRISERHVMPAPVSLRTASEANAPDATDGENAVHFFAREGQIWLRWTVQILLVVTILTMVTFWFWAVVPATALLIAYGALMFVNAVEKRSDQSPAASVETAAPEADAEAGEVYEDAGAEVAQVMPEVAMPLLKHETKVLSILVGAVLLLAAIMALVFFGGKTMLIAIPFLFAYILLLCLPVWLAAFEDDVEEVSDRLGGE